MAHKSRPKKASKIPQSRGSEAKRPWYKYSKYPPLSVTHPEIAAQWHPTKNGNWLPSEFTFGSLEQVWWKCPQASDHVWKDNIYVRTHSPGKFFRCPFCEGRKLCKSNSIAGSYPKIAKEWHPSKNGNLTPLDFMAKSVEYAWWKCPKGPDHEWRSVIYNRTVGGSRCPFCCNLVVSLDNSLEANFPDIAKQWHPTKNKSFKPSQFTKGSGHKVWWKCPEGKDHEWQATIDKRTQSGQNCPFCAGRKVSKTNSLAYLFPEIAKEWDKSKNGDLTPSQVAPGCNKKVWWICKKGPDHVWQTKINSRTDENSKCPFCVGRWASLNTSLAAINPLLASEWHKTLNKPLTPQMVLPNSNKIVWWQCNTVKHHIFQRKIQTRNVNRAGCPICRLVK